MKRATIILGLALFAAAFGTQQAITLQHSYKEGEKDAYAFNVSVNIMQLGAAEVNMQLEQLVKKVYENGDADVESSYKDFRASLNGSEIPFPAPPTSLVRYNKAGVPLNAGKGGGMMASLSYLNYSTMMVDKPLTVGQEIPIDQKDPKDGSTVKGKVKVESLVDGVAKLISHFDISRPGAEKPFKLDVTSFVEVSTSKPNSVEGTATDLPADAAGQGGPQIESIKFKMERKK